MWNEFHELYDVNLLKTLIISKIEDNNYRYHRYYNGTLLNMLTGVYDYVKNGKYSQDCVDLCDDAACCTLNINIGIFQNVGGFAQCINYKAERPTNRDIFLWYYQDHYESIMFTDSFSQNQSKYLKRKYSQTAPDDLGSEESDHLGHNNNCPKYNSSSTPTLRDSNVNKTQIIQSPKKPESSTIINNYQASQTIKLQPLNSTTCDKQGKHDHVTIDEVPQFLNKWLPS